MNCDTFSGWSISNDGATYGLDSSIKHDGATSFGIMCYNDAGPAHSIYMNTATGLPTTSNFLTIQMSFWLYLDNFTGNRHGNYLPRVYLRYWSGSVYLEKGVGAYINEDGTAHIASNDNSYYDNVVGDTHLTWNVWHNVTTWITGNGNQTIWVDNVLEVYDGTDTSAGGYHGYPVYVCLSGYGGSYPYHGDAYHVDTVELSLLAEYDLYDLTFDVRPIPILEYAQWYTLAQGESYFIDVTTWINEEVGGVGNWSYGTTGLTDNSTLARISSHTWVQWGNFTGGTFSIPITTRISAANTVYEGIYVEVNNTYVAQGFWIVYIWQSQLGEHPFGGGDVGGSEGIASFIVLFCIIGFPPMLLGAAGAKQGWGLQGMLFGGLFGLGIGVMIGLIPFWFVFLLALFVVLFLYSMASRS
jgi:hypothetical protein